jgi:hypothetical protein
MMHRSGHGRVHPTSSNTDFSGLHHQHIRRSSPSICNGSGLHHQHIQRSSPSTCNGSVPRRQWLQPFLPTTRYTTIVVHSLPGYHTATHLYD